MREKLIELLMQADSECFNRECKDCEYKGLSNCDSILTADYLIKNGVVIADGVVSKELYEQIKWERDVALKQLERIGVSLGEKTDSIVSVVRCEECEHRDEDGDICYYHSSFGDDKICYTCPDDYCSYGKPRKKGEE